MSDRRRLTLHIGQTKAGSTSIQNFLDARRESLLAQGVLFPDLSASRTNPFDLERTAGHLTLLIALADNNMRAEEVTALNTELAANPSARLVLCAESLFAARSDAEIARLGTYFRDWDIELLAVLRPQFDWLRSRYVENTLSGFFFSTEGFARFVQKMVAAGVIDYHSRLRHLAGLLGAKWIRAIPMNSDQGPLVPRFLRAAGLPVTDYAAAASQRSNIRETSQLLVEGRRRFNALCTGIPLALRLEIERAFLKLHKNSFEAAHGYEFRPEIPLSEAQISDLRRSNQALVDDGTMAECLELGAPGRAMASDLPGAREFLQKGLQAAAQICEQYPERKALHGSLLRFGPDECAALAEALEGASVSTHLNAPDTALLAASSDHRLVRLHLAPGRDFWRRTSRLDAVTSPSPLVTRSTDTIGETGNPSSEVLVIGEGATADIAAPLLNQPGLRQVILLERARDLLHDLPLPPYRLHATGRCLFLKMQDPAPGTQAKATGSCIGSGAQL